MAEENIKARGPNQHVDSDFAGFMFDRTCDHVSAIFQGPHSIR